MKKQIYTLGLLCLSTLGLAQGNPRLNVAGSMKTDTLIGNVLKKEGGTANQVLLANGTVASPGSGLVLSGGVLAVDNSAPISASFQAALNLKLNASDTAVFGNKHIRLDGNQTVTGTKTFEDLQLNNNLKWLHPRNGTTDWDFVAVDSATEINGAPHRNLALRSRTVNSPDLTTFTFDPRGNLHTMGTIQSIRGISTWGNINTSSAVVAGPLVRGDTLRSYFLYPINEANPVTAPSFRIDNWNHSALRISSSNSNAKIGTSLQKAGQEYWFAGIPSDSYNYVLMPCASCNTSRVGIGTNTPTQLLDVIGNIRASGFVIANTTVLTSDRRLKTNISPLKPNAIAAIQQLHPVEYDKKDAIQSTQKGQHEYGFIAQEVQKILPLLVTTGNDKDQLLHLNYTALIPLLNKAIQEQQVIIEEQQANLKAQKAIIDELIKRVEKLGNR